MNQNRLVNLVSLSELQIQLFRGLLVVRTVEEHDPSARPPASRRVALRRKSRTSIWSAIMFLPFFLLLLLGHTSDLYLGRHNLDRMPRRVQHREAHCNLVSPLPHIAERRLELLVLPLAPIRRVDALLLLVLELECRWRRSDGCSRVRTSGRAARLRRPHPLYPARPSAERTAYRSRERASRPARKKSRSLRLAWSSCQLPDCAFEYSMYSRCRLSSNRPMAWSLVTPL
jgi:hypothetical protein